MYKSATMLAAKLSPILIETEHEMLNITRERQKMLNVFKMTIYVYCCLIELFEDKLRRQSSSSVSSEKGKKKKKSDELDDWDMQVDKASEGLLKLFSLPLNRLFNPPIVEEEVVK